jgi:hypothetical protein
LEAIAGEIRRLTAEIHQWGEHLRTYQAAGSSTGGGSPLPPSQEEQEIMALQWKLLDIANAQNEAIRQWNQNPIDTEIPSLEAKLYRLHQEYSEVLSRLQTLRGQRSK